MCCCGFKGVEVVNLKLVIGFIVYASENIYIFRGEYYWVVFSLSCGSGCSCILVRVG